MTRTASFSTILITFAIAIATVLIGFTPAPAKAASQSITSLAALQPGALIRGVSRSAVYYYGNDGFRYVFTNSKTFDTWYDNFDSVVWLTDADLATIQIGGNVTYRPGTRMIKIDSDPKTYAVGKGGSLHWVSSEAVAISLFGNTWNTMIDDVPDGFFSNYTASTEITSASQYVPATEKSAVPNINVDKGLVLPVTVSVGNSGYTPEAITIQRGQTVRWTNAGTGNHAVTSDDLTWGSGTMTPGVTFVRRFNEIGVYTYFDSYRTQSTGTIVVQ
ncbi:MAG: cupredoxin domain-containing protein [bacterium]|nr:cupredoxin domain-containing protein [bacterium]